MLKVNLRKAQKLRKSIEAALASFSLATTIGIDVDDSAVASNPETFIDKGRDELKLQMGRHKALSATLARLRISIAKKNLEAGVDEILAQAAEIDRSIKLLAAVSHPSRDTTAAITNKIQRLQRTLTRTDDEAIVYRGSTTSSVLNVSVVDQHLADEVNAIIVGLRRAKEELEDRRLEVNGSNFIEIGEDDVRVLRDMKTI